MSPFNATSIASWILCAAVAQLVYGETLPPVGDTYRVAATGDADGARILQRILDDEIRHVAFGTKHFAQVCGARGENPPESWKKLVKLHFAGAIKPPFNDSARLAAGLSRGFYAEIAH